MEVPYEECLGSSQPCCVVTIWCKISGRDDIPSIKRVIVRDSNMRQSPLQEDAGSGSFTQTNSLTNQLVSGQEQVRLRRRSLQPRQSAPERQRALVTPPGGYRTKTPQLFPD
jgi:hypothetical protein